MPAKIEIYDTTLRDGSQGEGISLSLQDKLRIVERLDRFGIDYIEGGWPGSNPKDMAFFKEAKKLKFKHAKLAAFGSTRRAHVKVSEDENLKALVEAGTKVITIFGKSWDFHVQEVFKTALKENLMMIRDSVSYLKAKKAEVIYDAEHFFDGFRENPEYAMKTIREAERAGCDRIVLCDTNGGALPEQVAIAVRKVVKQVKAPVGIHCHNDGDLAVANSISAVTHGATQVQGTINGYGERCGNANLISVIAILQLKLGYQVLSEKKMKELTEVSHFVAEVCNLPIQNQQPFTGTSAFAHKAGVHVNAMMKNAKTYEHMNPALVGNRRKFLVSELSGKSSILFKAKELRLSLDIQNPETRTILQKIAELESQGYQFEAAEASLELLMKRMLNKDKKFFTVKEVSVTTDHVEIENPPSRATVRIEVCGEEAYEVASGDGPVNALDNALRKALVKFYPVVEKIHLTDYAVRVVNSQAGTAAKVRVLIQFQDEAGSWRTVGVSENIIEASWKALIEAIEYKLMKS
ncbi:MAG: citramalate synthase [Omnitrophica bacterium RIFCSPLOWO2_12_FULL_44_17]|uniref:Citramalate synthase n=1 Tax=Candidatus Danuiimicrobium aquiferis TaxID=1801832 RepID=A0A1G1L1W8_9BACT|nr:MAG: citramalate synthase [Omnitrophica bacterium RIFCSPHIGHO2_02_FULL_45_28]OGW88256.1 MAG: citramalate synthase [Omnitrophica bacterium RIFCSPHIGHO2_12_FULL_44_12]OGW99141.1 MAG: citramalate synthase [Omnitrophica bacterium RIFCSPLOWO2_12_FULL_44_17]OGX03170.1 MAG: citramalate synthase [Omnitrophica bacterium RIFCSPLOWO2_02_FULL_44_11]